MHNLEHLFDIEKGIDTFLHQQKSIHTTHLIYVGLLREITYILSDFCCRGINFKVILRLNKGLINKIPDITLYYSIKHRFNRLLEVGVCFELQRT